MTLIVSAPDGLYADRRATYNTPHGPRTINQTKIYTDLANTYCDGARVIAAAACGALNEAELFIAACGKRDVVHLSRLRRQADYRERAAFQVHLITEKDGVKTRYKVVNGITISVITNISASGSGMTLYDELSELDALNDLSIAERAYLAAVYVKGCSPPIDFFNIETGEVSTIRLERERFGELSSRMALSLFDSKVPGSLSTTAEEASS